MQMKKLITGILLVLLSGFLSAQIIQGVIHYEVTMDVHRSLPAERQELRAMIPQFRTDNFQLFFSPSESLYKPREEEELPSGPRGGGGMRAMMRMPRTETYIDRGSRERTVAQDMMGRNFLIVDTISIQPWRFGNEQMEIAGFMCMMAWYTDTVANQEVTAWFAPQLPPFMGPDRFVTLPGTVLAVDINNGERVWVARSIEAREVKKAEIRKPNRGERMTREQFERMVAEQMQRMGGGAGAVFRF